MELNVASATEALARERPDAACLVQGDRELTWDDVRLRTRRLASLLAAHGLGVHPGRVADPRWDSPHDHVALYLHNCPEYLEGMLGAWKARCAPFNVNYRYVAEELRYLLEDAATAAVVVHDTFVPVLGEVLPGLSRRPELVLQVRDGSPHRLLPGAVEYEEALATAPPELPQDLAAGWSGDDLYLCYTGGTTGMPKGTMWRQADFLVAALGVRRPDGTDHESLDELVAGARPALRALPAPPLMHGAAHWNALSCWMAGGTVVMQSRVDRFDPGDVLDTVERHRATSLLLVGDPMARPLLDRLDRDASAGVRRDLSSLRHVLSGGAVLSPSSRARLIRALDVTVVDVLGSTESGRQAVASVRDAEVGGTGFRPSPTAVLLSEDRTRRLAPDEHEVGWLAQSGRVPLGYLGDRDKTLATFPVVDGVRHAVAGDRARWADDGTVELLGRDSVCVNTGGEKVFAEEVETAVKEHPDVADAVVCGRPSPVWGEEVVAVVAPRPGREVDLASVRAVAADHLAGFKLPRDLVLVETVVRSPSGKADYRWARSVAADRSDATDSPDGT